MPHRIHTVYMYMYTVYEGYCSVKFLYQQVRKCACTCTCVYRPCPMFSLLHNVVYDSVFCNLVIEVEVYSRN